MNRSLLAALISLALAGCGSRSGPPADNDPELYGKPNLESGEFTEGPGFKPGDDDPQSPVLESPLATAVLENASETTTYPVRVTGRIEQDCDLNNDNRSSGYLLIDEAESWSPSLPKGHDCFRLVPHKDGRDDALLAALAKEVGPDQRSKNLVTVNGWLSASGGWYRLEIVRIEIKDTNKGIQ